MSRAVGDDEEIHCKCIFFEGFFFYELIFEKEMKSFCPRSDVILPRKSFLEEIDVPSCLTDACSGSHVICKRTSTTDTNGACTSTLNQLLIHKRLDIRLSRKHLDGR